MQQGFFLVRFFCFLVVLFFVACVLVLVFCKKAQKGYFPAILEVFCLFCSPKRPVFKILFFFLFCFLFWFSFCIPFQNSILSLCFLAISPFLENINIFGFFICFLFFPFLMFACFIQTNFPNIPFLKPKLLSFWLFIYFFCCFCFLFSYFMFLPFCFDVGFVFGMFYFVIVLF